MRIDFELSNLYLKKVNIKMPLREREKLNKEKEEKTKIVPREKLIFI